jgi:hypothetical protein
MSRAQISEKPIERGALSLAVQQRRHRLKSRIHAPSSPPGSASQAAAN